MAKMKDTEVRAKVMSVMLEALKNGSFMDKAEAAGKQTVAYPVELDVEGNGELVEVWGKMEMSVPHWKPYNARGERKEAYNPFEVEAEWQDELARREAKAKEAADKKAKKIAKSKAVMEKAEG